MSLPAALERSHLCKRRLHNWFGVQITHKGLPVSRASLGLAGLGHVGSMRARS
jgi:hypothetical protein